MKKKAIVIIALGLLAGSAQSALAGDPPRDGDADADVAADLTSYASDFGVSIEEAAKRLEMQEHFVDVVATVADLEPDRFAGSSIDHGDHFKLTIYLVGQDLPDEWESTIDDSQLPIRISPRAARSLDAARKTIEDIGGLLEEVSGFSGIWYDVQRQEFVLDLVGESETALRASLPAELPAEIRGARIEMLSEETSVGRRGGLVTTSCTSGFTVRNAAGTRGITTAGHCGNSQSYRLFGSSTWYSTTFRAQLWNNNTDLQWHSTANVEPRFHASSTSSTRPVTSQATRNGQSGAYVCHRGAATGYSCGTVSSIVYQPPSAVCNGQTCSAVWIRASGPSLKCYLGDSGGPVFYDNRAYGIYSGQSSSGTTISGCNFMYYMGINYVINLNVTLLYG